jgi:hypothetical protein
MIRAVGAEQLRGGRTEATQGRGCCVVALATLIGLGVAWWASGSLAKQQRLAVLVGAPVVSGVAGLILWTLCSGRRAVADAQPPAYEDLSAPPQQPAAPLHLELPQPETPQAAVTAPAVIQPLPDAPAKQCPLIARTTELRIAQMGEPVRVNPTLIRRIARVGLQGLELARPVGTSDAAMLALVEYCHTLHPPADLDSALALLRLVSALELADLKARLELALADRLDAESAARIRTVALTTNSEWLVRHAEAELHLHTNQFIGFARGAPLDPPQPRAPFAYLAQIDEGVVRMGLSSVHPEAFAVAFPTKWAEIQFLVERGSQTGGAPLISSLADWIYKGRLEGTAPLSQMREWLAQSPALPGFYEQLPASRTRRLLFGTTVHEGRESPEAGRQYAADSVECDSSVSQEELDRLASQPILGLRALDLDGCPCSAATLERLIGNNRGITRLHIGRTGAEIDPDRFASILAPLRRLERLALANQQLNWARLSKTTPDLVGIVYHHPSLRMCHLDELAEALPFWPNLCGMDIDELNLACLLQLGPRLTHLVVRRAPDASQPQALTDRLAQLIPQLQQLEWRYLDHRLYSQQLARLRGLTNAEGRKILNTSSS